MPYQPFTWVTGLAEGDRRHIDLLTTSSRIMEAAVTRRIREGAAAARAPPADPLASLQNFWSQKRAPRRGQPAFRGGAMAGTLSSSGSQSSGASTCVCRVRIVGMP